MGTNMLLDCLLYLERNRQSWIHLDVEGREMALTTRRLVTADNINKHFHILVYFVIEHGDAFVCPVFSKLR